MSAPRISIVVPGAGTSPRLEETLTSLESQAYAALETIVERGGASMGEALERGFARATGEIHGYVKPGDVLLPGALSQVAAAIAPREGRPVVLGRALWIVEGEAPVPHPSEWLGPFEHLAIWKRRFDTLPQPALFWHREVTAHLRPFLRADAAVVDYDVACRLGTRYPIARLDHVLAACRLHTGEGTSEAQLLDDWTRVSRRYWGAWLSPRRWRLECSYRWHQRHPHEHARHHARRSEKAMAEGRRVEALLEAAMAWCWSPAMARGRLGYLRVEPRKS